MKQFGNLTPVLLGSLTNKHCGREGDMSKYSDYDFNMRVVLFWAHLPCEIARDMSNQFSSILFISPLFSFNISRLWLNSSYLGQL